MTTYNAIITYTDIVEVNADSEEQAIEQVKAKLPPRVIADVVIAKEVKISEDKQDEEV